MITSLYDLTVQDIEGKEIKLETFKGKVLLIVNVASKCGFTPQYAGLQALYQEYQKQGLEILGFPANNFLWQEPGTDSEIKQFCALKYNVTFPMFAKISVDGKNTAPLYAFLTSKSTNPEFAGKIKWNFTKFLVDRKGVIAGRFESAVEPQNSLVVNKIRELLAQ